jgi:hypothetical protein
MLRQRKMIPERKSLKRREATSSSGSGNGSGSGSGNGGNISKCVSIGELVLALMAVTNFKLVAISLSFRLLCS